MTKLTNKSVIINTIRLIKSPKLNNGATFLINEGTNSQMFLNVGFVRSIFIGLGLSTRTPFLKLVGSTISYKEFTITQEMLDAAGGNFILQQPGRDDVTFKSIGTKHTDHALLKTSAQFDAQVAAAALDFETDWAGTPAPVAAKTPVIETPITETPITETPITETPITETPITETPDEELVKKQPINAVVEEEEVNLDEETM